MLRFSDADRTLRLSVRDLVEAAPPSGHLVLESAQSQQARLKAGQRAHLARQAEQAAVDAAYQAEVMLAHTFEIAPEGHDPWTVVLQGRVDGLTEVAGRPVVEEIKSTVLDADRLYDTALEDWPAYTAQLELYLWLLTRSGRDPQGRLVLVSVLDGSRHVLPCRLDDAAVSALVEARCRRLLALHERRLAWLADRRTRTVPNPFGTWRPGQAPIADRVLDALHTGRRLLVQAPTGLGKTAAVLHGALSWALREDKQLFWATSRNTQQRQVVATLQRFADAGLPLSWVGLRAREKVCLNDVVVCRPDACRFARDYHDKLAAAGLVESLAGVGTLTPDDAMGHGREHEVCPAQLALDVAEHVDVVVGDVNHAVAPVGRLERFFGGSRAEGWGLVVDEAHQLVDRAREHHSPRVEADLARRALDALRDGPDALDPYVPVAEAIVDAVLDVVQASPGPDRDGLAEAQLAIGPWKALAARLDELALDYTLLRAQGEGCAPLGEDDPWIDVARQVLRFAAALDTVGAETVGLVRATPGAEDVRLLCLDPSPHLRPGFAALGGLVGCSATLAPQDFFVSQLGLPDDTARLEVPSPFPAARRAVLLAPWVSTRFRDRRAHADRTARLLTDLVTHTPGNVAVYFPSFAMLDDLAPRLAPADHTVLVQPRGLSEADRAAWLARLSDPRERLVLAAVLGGIFAEGVDLPPGALSAVAVVGPALPPVGRERDLLRAYYDERFGEGFRFASLVPGMTKVVQAAGRLVRRAEDRGTIVLVGQRFRWRDHRALLPADWSPQVPVDLGAALDAFWSTPAVEA